MTTLLICQPYHTSTFLLVHHILKYHAPLNRPPQPSSTRSHPRRPPHLEHWSHSSPLFGLWLNSTDQKASLCSLQAPPHPLAHHHVIAALSIRGQPSETVTPDGSRASLTYGWMDGWDGCEAEVTNQPNPQVHCTHLFQEQQAHLSPLSQTCLLRTPDSVRELCAHRPSLLTAHPLHGTSSMHGFCNLPTPLHSVQARQRGTSHETGRKGCRGLSCRFNPSFQVISVDGVKIRCSVSGKWQVQERKVCLR